MERTPCWLRRTFHTATVYSHSHDADTIIDTAVRNDSLAQSISFCWHPRIIYTSCCCGVFLAAKTEEDWQKLKHSPYTIANGIKTRMELAETHDLDLRVINPGGVLGGRFVNPTPSIDYFHAIKENFPLHQNTIPIVHVRDVARAHRRLKLTKPKEVYPRPHDKTIADVCRSIRVSIQIRKPSMGYSTTPMFIVVFQDWIMDCLAQNVDDSKSSQRIFSRRCKFFIRKSSKSTRS